MSIFLCGNTGCINRGCEAIIRSTVKVLNKRNGNVYLATFAPEQDRIVSAELGINMISYDDYPSRLIKFLCCGIHKLVPKTIVHQRFIQRSLWSRLSDKDICLNIGGDTYCYGRPEACIALNKYAFQNGIKSILWCCSIEADKIKGDILDDLKRYTYIFVREQITYQTLLDAGISQDKLVQCCDPAFFLNKRKVKLPDSFIQGNTVGINISELVVKPGEETVYMAIIGLIKYILNATDMSICLIPHVYSIKENKCDYPILKRIYDEIDNERVCIVDEEKTCEEIKYIISKCRFLIASRTHASIAAYSTGIPTLVLGYSVKSTGIAKDLFGDPSHYVIPYTSIENEAQLIEAYKYIESNEQRIKETLEKRIPDYKNTLLSAIQKYLPKEKDERLCDHSLCTGCGSCAASCPINCITMQQDNLGLLYPIIDYTRCINCGKCNKSCPVANRKEDDGALPIAFAAKNVDEQVRNHSSSGGVFMAIAEAVIRKGGVVIGAAFDSHFQVKHICCTTVAQLCRLQGSKYVQSEMGDMYDVVKNSLSENRYVLFSGTPCQVAGLKAYLKKDSELLLTVDFICHGVAAPFVWERYKEYRKIKAGADINSIMFRDKTDGWKNFSLSMVFQNGNVYRDVVGKDPYMRLFINNYSIRKSCDLCAFRNMHRQADITLADYWGFNEIGNMKNDDKGISLVLIHSTKGKKMIHDIDTQLMKCAVNVYEGIQHNPAYLKNQQTPILRNGFVEDFEKKDFGDVLEEYNAKGVKKRIKLYKIITKEYRASYRTRI